MRRMTLILMLVSLLLAACGGGDDPTTQSPPPSPMPEATTPPTVETTAQVEATQDIVAATVAAVFPPVGEVAALETEDPNAGSGFDYISFEQTGGPANTPLAIEIYRDGRVIVNGEESEVEAPQLDALAAQIDTLNFFGLQGNFVGPAQSDQVYTYRLFVSRGDQSRSIQAIDGYIPPEVMTLLAQVRTLGQSAP